VKVIKKSYDTELSTAERKAKNAYIREWRRNNKERIRIINKKYWRKKVLKNKKALEVLEV